MLNIVKKLPDYTIILYYRNMMSLNNLKAVIQCYCSYNISVQQFLILLLKSYMQNTLMSKNKPFDYLGQQMM